MDYVDLGKIEIKRTGKKKLVQKRKRTSARRSTVGKLSSVSRKKRSTKRQPINNNSSSSRFKKVAFPAVFMFLLLFGIYSFLPQIKNLWFSVIKGPAIVMSYLKDDPDTLKQDDGVTNILLIGIDKRSVEPYSYERAGGEEIKNGFLADTILVVSYHHESQSVVMLSLPRDLWVEIPAFGDVYKQHTKINASYAIGDMYGYDGGGLALTKEVVSTVLGIPIHYTARVDFEGFIEAIDLLGGVDVEVENTFDDWRYPKEGYENAPMEERFIHLHFDAGMQRMDGETALRFARSRQGTNGEGSDFARAKRQQKVIMAAYEKAVSMNLVESISKLSDLLDTFGETVESDMELTETLVFYKIAQKIDLSSLETFVLDTADEQSGLLYNPPTEQFGGGWVLLPVGGNWDMVQEFVHKIFYTDRTLESSDLVEGNTEELQ